MRCAHQSCSIVPRRINKPGGCAKITKVHYTEDGSNIEALDVKYVLGGGCEKEIDPAIISPYETLERGGRKRRGREFLMDRAQDVVKKVKRAIQSSGGSTTKNKKQESIPKCSKQTLGRQPKQRKTPAAKKTKERDHSTSPSTPVTPEHPSTHNRRKAKLLKLGEVPSYVIADGAVEVSPLPLDRAVVEQKKPTEARRGLFRSSPDVGEARPPTVVPGHPKSCATAKKTSTLASGLLPKPKTDKAIKPSAFSLYQSKPVGAKSTITGERKFGPRFMSNCPKPIKPFGKKEPLKRVFDYEVQKAREFLDEVYRAPCNDVSILGPSTKNTDFTPATSQPRDEKPKETS